ncbi:hypothetical protein [Paenarthrobacter sp. C1]|uniref:hypothetical protein n=1 Tax=Paenarthrobacter sp. C1 TaxID=3400220 RepID=UPI003BF60FAE
MSHPAPRPIEPLPVVELVDGYVRKALHDADAYSNVELLDESGVFSLHRVAAEIYALGFRDGEDAQSRRHDHERMRTTMRQEQADRAAATEKGGQP